MKQFKVSKEFEDLFRFGSEKEELEHHARIISFRFLSEVEKTCDKRKINRKELAKLVGTSPGYITQLFRGNKIANMKILAKLQKVLNIQFSVQSKNTILWNRQPR